MLGNDTYVKAWRAKLGESTMASPYPHGIDACVRVSWSPQGATETIPVVLLTLKACINM